MPTNYIYDRYLDSEERYEVRVVKAAERPHLVHWEEEDDMNASSSSDEKKTDDESFQPPLTDGCDLPGWRARRLAPCVSVEKKHIDSIGLVLGGCLNIGSGATLFRRESQFPFITSNVDSCWWHRTKEKLCVPPPVDRDAPVVKHDEMCALVDYVKSNGCNEESRKVTYFSLEFEEKGLPVKILGATFNWPAMPDYDEENHSKNEANKGWADMSDNSDLMTAKGCGGWTFANLVSRFGNISWRYSDQHGEMMSLNTYAKYITSPEGQSDDSPLGIYDSQFGDDDPTSLLLNEYTVPKCFSQDLFELQSGCDSDEDNSIEEVPRPPYRWILIGPERSGTGLHVDPLWTNAWVTVLQGKKRWLLFPPETPHELIGMIEGQPQIPSSIWFADYYEKVTSTSWPTEYKPTEILQYHGETVFVPAGWPHLVLNLELTVAVTHNYASEFGPFKRMCQDVVEEEPEFAVRWYAGLKENGREDLASCLPYKKTVADDS
ncbi:hypothetical protein ACHAWT_010544 [Skeletonema menzelii]